MTQSNNCFWPHPFLSNAHLVARIAVMSATLIWAMAVLLQTSALNFATYSSINFLHEDIWGGVYFLVGLGVFYRTWFHKQPHKIGSVLNGAMAFLWTYNTIGLALFWSIIPPGGFGASITIMSLSYFNLIATAKKLP